MAAARLPTEAERQQIRRAVERAECRTRGEIVPFLVERSGRYEIAVWRAAFLAGAVALAGFTLALRFHRGWGPTWLYDSLAPALVTAVAAGLGGLAAAYAGPLRRWLAGSDRLERAARERAVRAFFEEEVFDTRGRTGILLFVSLFERRIEVVADVGIRQKVSPEEWQAVVGLLGDSLGRGRLADGLVKAIGRLGELLEQSGVEARADDADELPDDARLGNGD